MFGEISIWAWMGGAIMFAIGGATGFFISRQLKDKRTLELEEKLAATRTELADYRGDVNQHFLKTSLLVSKLTNNYREVYEHLATGAQKLCNDKTGTPKLDLPEKNILPTVETTNEDTPLIQPAADIAQEASSETAIEAEVTADQAIGIDHHTETGEQPAGEGAPSSEEKQSAKEENTAEPIAARENEKPAPEDVPGRDENDEEVHLGAESTPSVDTEHHKTHPAIH